MVELLAPGHRGCAGCPASICVRQVLDAAGPNTICTCSTGCLEVMTTPYPETAWRVPWIHTAFENSAAMASGIEVAYKALNRRNGTDKKPNIIAFAGDGGTFDIGLQALSGALERGHRMLFVCYDNEAYMNTGIQRCSSTPIGAWTTTSPEGSCSFGKTQRKKPIAMIAAAHDIPYVATACISYPQDLKAKVKKALACDGPSFLHVFAPCPTGWRFASDKTIAMGKLAVESGVFVLYEMTDADPMKPVVTYKPKEFKPVEEYLKAQGRFAHLFKPARDETTLKRIQEDVDRKLKWVGLK